MIERFQNGKVTWLDVVHPTSSEIREIFKECSLPTEFADDLTSMTPRTESKAVDGALKITLDFPVVKRIDIKHPHEVKLIASKNYLITIRFEDIQAVHQFGKEFEVMSLLEKNPKEITGAHYLFALLNSMYTALDNKLDYLETKTQTVEEQIFENDEKAMLLEISKISRRLITFKHTMATHEGALKSLKQNTEEAFGKGYATQLNRLQVVYFDLMRRASGLSNVVEELRSTNDALLNSKQNEVMKILTIMAFITFPLSLFTSMFGMNTQKTPILGMEHDFWIILGIMTFITLCFFAFFKYKRWM